jgi:polar amino acid transport system substrate-binding protein
MAGCVLEPIVKRADVKALLMLIIGIACANAWPAQLRLCVDQASHLPFITPDAQGTAGLLIRQAAKEAGVTLILSPAPVARCREEIRAGKADAFPTTPYTPAVTAFMVFPMKDGRPDTTAAVSQNTAQVFRRVGSAVDWDGKRFHGLSTAALIPSGAVLLKDRLRDLGVPEDDGAKSLEANFAKLLVHRADVAIGSSYSAHGLLAQARFAGIEALPVPFSDEAYYLSFSRRFADQHPELVARMWSLIVAIKARPEYQRQAAQTMQDYARTLKE